MDVMRRYFDEEVGETQFKRDERLAELVRQVRDGTWRMPATQEFSSDFLNRILPGKERHSIPYRGQS